MTVGTAGAGHVEDGGRSRDARRLTQVTGRAAVLDRADVDTDQIIPKQFLKRIERSGYGEFLFYDWMKDPAFELHRPEYEGAAILVAGRNFGCGSSREHAAWALEDYGFRAVLAPSFGDIFRSNAIKSGLAPIELPEAELARSRPRSRRENELTVDLEALEITHPSGLRVPIELDALRAHDARPRARRHRAHAAARGPDRRLRGGDRGALRHDALAQRGCSQSPRGSSELVADADARRRRRAAPATRGPRPQPGDLRQPARDRAAVGMRAARDDRGRGAGRRPCSIRRAAMPLEMARGP